MVIAAELVWKASNKQSIHQLRSEIAQLVNHLQAMQETQVQLLGREDPLEEEMATHSSMLAWRITETEEPDRLQSMGLQESDMT